MQIWAGASRAAVAFLAVVLALDLPGALAQNSEVGGRGRQSEQRRVASEPDFLLVAAQSELSRNQPNAARKTLETLISRFPEEPAAEDARRLLALLNRSPPASSDGASRDTALQGTDAFLQSAIPARASGDAPSTLTARRIGALDQEFRSTVGDRVFFGDTSTEIGSRSRSVLAAQADWLKRHPALFITIDGHADDSGSTDLNRELAARRAEAVRARLIEEGIEPDRIRVRALGRESRIAPCPDPGCAAHNRRVITVITDRFGATNQAAGRTVSPASGQNRPRGN